MELLTDYQTELAMAGIVLDPSYTVVLRDGPYVRALKRSTRNPNLFLYYHRHTRNFVLAAWLGRNGPRLRACIEIEAMRLKPEWGGWPSVPEMTARLRITHQAQIESIREKILEARAEEAVKRDADAEYRAGVGKMLKRKGLFEAGTMIENNAVPFERLSDDEWHRSKSNMLASASGRVMSLPGFTPKGLVDRHGKSFN